MAGNVTQNGTGTGFWARVSVAILVAVSGCQIGGPAKLEPVGEARVDIEHAACIKKDTHHPKLWIGVYAARNLDTLLSRIGKSSV